LTFLNLVVEQSLRSLVRPSLKKNIENAAGGVRNAADAQVVAEPYRIPEDQLQALIFDCDGKES
jgi:hypothetical protein